MFDAHLTAGRRGRALHCRGVGDLDDCEVVRRSAVLRRAFVPPDITTRYQVTRTTDEPALVDEIAWSSDRKINNIGPFPMSTWAVEITYK
jgi:hypothetical protein